MVDSLVVQEIFDDANFQKLVDDKTDLEAFTKLLDENVSGYSQKKRFSDGLKDFSKKVEDAENRLIVARNVGKFKEPDPEDMRWTAKASSFELKQKIQTVSTLLETMISEGKITHTEKPSVLDNLRTRLAKAKEGGKAKLEEKLDTMSTAVVRAMDFSLPVANLEQFHQLDKELQAIAKLEKLNAKSLTMALRDRIENKVDLQAEFDGLIDVSRMWFETPLEFKPRLSEAMAAYAAGEEERKKKEEDEAFEKKNREEQEALEKKRAAAEKKALEAAKALEQKLEAKRIEAAAKPVKEVPKKQPKEKKVLASVDLKQMFHEEIQQSAEAQAAAAAAVSATEVQEELEKAAKNREFARAYAEMQQAVKEAEEAKKERAIKETKASKQAEIQKLAKVAELKDAKKTAVVKAAAAKESKWAEPAKPTKTAEEKLAEEEKKFKAIEEKLAAKKAADATAPKKEVKEPPKKVEKKVTKMSLLDFYSDDKDSILDQLAAQEAKEKAERAAAAEEAAAKAAEEEEAYTAEEDAAWAAEQAAILPVGLKSATVAAPVPSAYGLAASAKPVAAVAAVVKPAPRPKRKPVEIESKWGAPKIPEGAIIEDDDGDMPSLAESMPSLADALTAPVKKSQPPPAKKSAKKKWGKVDAGLIGFDADNPNAF